MTLTSTTGPVPRSASSRRRPRLQHARHVLVVLAALLLVWTLTYELALRNRLATWGATEAEASAAMPGDELVPDPLTQTTRAVSTTATPRQVWPWLARYGVVERFGVGRFLGAVVSDVEVSLCGRGCYPVAWRGPRYLKARNGGTVFAEDYPRFIEVSELTPEPH